MDNNFDGMEDGALVGEFEEMLGFNEGSLEGMTLDCGRYDGPSTVRC